MNLQFRRATGAITISLLGSPTLLYLVGRFAHGLMSLRNGRSTAECPTFQLVLTPPGGGNIGDQAMVEAFLDNVQGPVLLILTSENSVEVPADHMERVQSVVMRGLIYGSLAANLMAHLRLCRLLRKTASFSLFGADVMDGAYNFRASSNRSNLATLISTYEIQTRILGFSWNADPNPTALRALKRAGLRGCKLMVRDSLSFSRLEHADVTGLVQSADIVFTSREACGELPEMIASALAGRPEPLPVAVLNVSGLIARKMDQTAAYVSAINLLEKAGYQVILVPHVSHPSGDDITACRAVRDSATWLRTPILLDELVDPASVRAICEVAQIVVTGRMHLAIMAFMNGKPPITLASQGKVEGLYDMFGGCEWLAVSPDALLESNLLTAIERLMGSEQTCRDIQQSLPRVRQLGHRNYESIGS